MKEQESSNAGYVDRIPIAGAIRRIIDKDVARLGFQQTAARLISIAGEGKLVVEGKDDLVREVLKTKPVVVISNHPSFAEILTVIASLEPRDDMSLIGMSVFQGVGPNISEHVIPVYMTPRMDSKRYGSPIIRAGNALRFGPQVSTSEAPGKNFESIGKAIEKVKEGGLVVIFPEGVASGRKDKKWRSGIGHLVSGIGTETKAYLVFAYCEGTSNLDFMRIVPGVKRFLPTMRVTFAEPRLIASSIGEDMDPRAITKKIEQEYHAWTSSLALG